MSNLYSRADYEADMQRARDWSAAVSRAIANGTMDGIEAQHYDREIKEFERLCWNQLQRTRLICSSNQRKAPKGVHPDNTYQAQFDKVTCEQGAALANAGRMVRFVGEGKTRYAEVRRD